MSVTRRTHIPRGLQQTNQLSSSTEQNVWVTLHLLGRHGSWFEDSALLGCLAV